MTYDPDIWQFVSFSHYLKAKFEYRGHSSKFMFTIIGEKSGDEVVGATSSECFLVYCTFLLWIN